MFEGTDWTTVFVALATGATAAGGPALLHWLEARREKKAVRAAILAEVQALATLIRSRRYCEGLEELMVEIASLTPEQKASSEDLPYYAINIPEDYNLIYRENISRLGVLQPKDASAVVRFYKVLMAVSADITPGGALYEGTTNVSSVAENLGMLRAALAIADMLHPRGDGVGN